MIVKIKSHKRPAFRGLFEYMLHDKHRLAGQGRGFIVAHNLKGNRIDDWVTQLKENEKRRKRRRKDSVIITHEILSWHKEDSWMITPEKMESMTREYIRRRGIRGMYFAVPHFDREHYHVHILVAGVDREGKAMRMSRQELADLKKGIQQYQIDRHPELRHSIVRHGRKDKTIIKEREYQLRTRTQTLSKREQVRQLVESCYTQAISQDDFYARLEACRLQTYVRGGRVYGVVYDGRNYRFEGLGVQNLDKNTITKECEEETIKQRKKEKNRSR